MVVEYGNGFVTRMWMIQAASKSVLPTSPTLVQLDSLIYVVVALLSPQFIPQAVNRPMMCQRPRHLLASHARDRCRDHRKIGARATAAAPFAISAWLRAARGAWRDSSPLSDYLRMRGSITLPRSGPAGLVSLRVTFAAPSSALKTIIRGASRVVAKSVKVTASMMEERRRLGTVHGSTDILPSIERLDTGYK